MISTIFINSVLFRYLIILNPSVLKAINTNVCLIKIRSKHSSNTLLSLLRFFMRQTLAVSIFHRENGFFGPTKGTRGVQHHKFLSFDGKQHSKNI